MQASRSDLARTISYAIDPAKTTAHVSEDDESEDGITERKRYVSGIGCIPSMAASQFIETKEFWSRVTDFDKTSGTVCYSGYMSFKENEVDADTAHEIGVELAERLWGDSHEAVVATHLNTGHIHVHFIVNSVSWVDGSRESAVRKAHHDLRIEANRICAERGLSVIEEQYGYKRPMSEYLAEKEGRPTLRNLIRWDIDRAVRMSVTFSEFIRRLESMGYSVIPEEDRQKGYPGLRPPGGNRYYSFKKLGAEYELDRITERLLQKDEREENDGLIRREAEEYRKSTEPSQNGEGLIGKWNRFRYELDLLVRFPGSVPEIPVPIRQEMIRPDRIDRSIGLLSEYGIDSEERLDEFIRNREESMELLIEKRRKYDIDRLNAYRKGDAGLRRHAAEKMSQISAQLRELRPQLRTARQTRDQSGRIEDELELMMSLHGPQEEKEERRDEQLLDAGS